MLGCPELKILAIGDTLPPIVSNYNEFFDIITLANDLKKKKSLYDPCPWCTGLSTFHIASLIKWQMVYLLFGLLRYWLNWHTLNFIYFQSNILHKLGFSQLSASNTKLYILFSLLHHSAIHLNDTSHLCFRLWKALYQLQILFSDWTALCNSYPSSALTSNSTP